MRARDLVPRRARTFLVAVVSLFAALSILGLAGCGSGGVASPRDPGELTNLRLGIDYSHWMLGPIARMATPEEIAAFRALDDDFAALELVEAFWARRDPDPSTRANEARATFERRAQEADRRYGEAGVLGRRTPRGTIHVLYGEPESIDFEIPLEEGAPIEIWTYPENASEGLDGQPPARVYRFRKQGELTLPYQPGGRRDTLPALRS